MRAGAAGSGCMVPLNLLPHREAARLFHRRRWHAMLGAALVVAMLTGGLLHLQAQQRISREEQATQVLEAALAQQGPKAAEVQKLEAALRQGRERLQQWQAWQQKAQAPLRLLEMVVRELPAGGSLSRVELEPGQLLVQGTVPSREAATALREGIDGAGVTRQPALLADVREDKDGAVFRLVLPLEKEALPGRLSAAGAVDGGEAAE